MLNKLIEYFFPQSDWRLVEVMHGEWDVEYRDDFYEKYTVTKTSIYEIYYSPSKNEYKLQISGYKPKEHSQYITATKRANQLQNESKVIKETP